MKEEPVEFKTVGSVVKMVVYDEGDVEITVPQRYVTKNSDGEVTIIMTEEQFEELVKAYQDYKIDQIFNTPDEEILASIGKPGYPSQKDIDNLREIIKKTVAKARKKRINNEIS